MKSLVHEEVECACCHNKFYVPLKLFIEAKADYNVHFWCPWGHELQCTPQLLMPDLYEKDETPELPENVIPFRRPDGTKGTGSSA